MSDIKLFRISNNSVSQVEGQSMAVERSLQTLLENHLESFLGVRLIKSEHTTGKSHGGRNNESTVTDKLAKASADVKDRFESLKAFAEALGDDVQVKTLKHYIAFKRIKNFAAVEIHPQDKNIIVFVRADFENIHLEEGFTRDVRTIGHFGTGNLEITIKSDSDLERAKLLIIKSYEDN